MSQDSQDLIKKHKERLRLLRSEAEVVRQHLIRDCASFLKTWYEAKAREYVLTEPEKTQLLPKESIKQMKEKVLHLGESSEEIASDVFKDASFTMPFEEDDSKDSQESCKGGEEFLRLALGRLGSILQEYGFLTDTNHWFKVDSLSGSILARYPYKMDLPQDISSLVSEYDSLVIEAGELRRQIKELFSKGDSDVKVQNIWDSL